MILIKIDGGIVGYNYGRIINKKYIKCIPEMLKVIHLSRTSIVALLEKFNLTWIYQIKVVF